MNMCSLTGCKGGGGGGGGGAGVGPVDVPR